MNRVSPPVTRKQIETQSKRLRQRKDEFITYIFICYLILNNTKIKSNFI